MRADKWFYFHEKRKRKEKLNERKKEQQRTFDPSVPHVFLVSGARTTCVRGSSLEALEAFLHDGKPSDVLTGFFSRLILEPVQRVLAGSGLRAVCELKISQESSWPVSSLAFPFFRRNAVEWNYGRL